MNRRDIIKYTTLISGAALYPSVLGTFLSSCDTREIQNNDGYQPEFFSPSDFEMVEVLVDTILPATDSPSASAVGVHKIIDHMVGATYKVGDRENFQDKFKFLANYLNEKGFMDLSDGEKLTILTGIESDAGDKVQSGFSEFKQLTVRFYLSTEQVAENFLNYLPVPGPYQACIDVSEVGNKIWAI